MPEYLVQKGVAGFGNRMQGLGSCLDTALTHNMDLIVDWRDVAWQTGFAPYFELKRIRTCPDVHLAELDKTGKTTWPAQWQGRLFSAPDAKLLTGRYEDVQTGSKDLERARMAGADVFVFSRYNSKYSDELFKRLVTSCEFRTTLHKLFCRWGLEPGSYIAYHMRYTDKKGEDPDTVLKKISKTARKSRMPVVLCTDYQPAVQEARRIENVFCYSSVPEVKRPGGVHHASYKELQEMGIARHDLNISTLADLFILGLAKEMVPTCPKSTFTQFADRGRKCNWFIKDWNKYSE